MATRPSPASTAIEPARSLAKFTTFDRKAGLLNWRAARREDTMRPTSIAIAAAMTANSHQRRRDDVRVLLEQPADRLARDQRRGRGDDHRLAERREVLRAAVAVGVLAVGRAGGEPHRDEREDGGDDVAAGLDARGDQREAARGEARAELERHEHARGDDRHQRGAGPSLFGRCGDRGHGAVAVRLRRATPRARPAAARRTRCRPSARRAGRTRRLCRRCRDGPTAPRS